MLLDAVINQSNGELHHRLENISWTTKKSKRREKQVDDLN
jgi:hypothetical protein